MNPAPNARAAARRVMARALGWLLLWLAGGFLALWLESSFGVLALTVTCLGLLFCVFTRYFFRDPEPRVPTTSGAVVSPAHGLVDCVEKSTELEFIGGPCRRISIFLSVFDVHVQNAPIAGQVVFFKYQPGRFLSALRTESATHNENALLGIESSERPGERIAVRQIAGLLARRVVSWVGPGDPVTRGQRLGLIQFGSRCDLYLPGSVQVTIRPGDRVVGGETVVAQWPKPASGSNDRIGF